ncbi:MAG: HNH endonuclease [Thermoplasmatota archaeon]
MPWLEDVGGLLGRLPGRFTLEQIYAFVPFLVGLHPENDNVEAKVRQILQQLRDEGRVRFLGDGNYEQVGAAEPTIVDFPMVPGTDTTRAMLSRLLGQAGDAPLRRGMFKPATGPYRNHMFLFHNEAENPYGDVHDGQTVRYIGQGMKGNQRLQSFNAILASHADNGVQVHYFTQPKNRPGKVRYVGPVFVESYDEVFRQDEGRKVLEFTLLPTPTKSGLALLEEYGHALDHVTSYERPAGPVVRPLVESVVGRRLRDKAFQRRVLIAYHAQCAICGNPMKKGRLSELEAAHIRAVNAGGPDELRNGLSLCGRHHWAFDHGMYTLDLSHRIEWIAPAPDPHGEVHDGAEIRAPRGEHAPHVEYIRWHRAQWDRTVN